MVLGPEGLLKRKKQRWVELRVDFHARFRNLIELSRAIPDDEVERVVIVIGNERGSAMIDEKKLISMKMRLRKNWRRVVVAQANESYESVTGCRGGRMPKVCPKPERRESCRKRSHWTAPKVGICVYEGDTWSRSTTSDGYGYVSRLKTTIKNNTDHTVSLCETPHPL
jgi:hypothetical protein